MEPIRICEVRNHEAVRGARCVAKTEGLSCGRHELFQRVEAICEPVTAARAGAKTVLPARVRGLFLFAGVIVILQTVVGILNLLFYIPPHITVPHQTLAMILLGITLRLWFEARSARLLGAVELVGGGVSDKASRAQAGLQASEAGGGQTSVDVVLS